MKNISGTFKRALYENERNYIAYADITLIDGTVLPTLSNSELWAGGFSYEEAVSEDNNFTALGSVIIGSAKIILDNIDGEYTQYDFSGATVVLYLGMELTENDTTRLEKFKVGTYIVDETSYTGGRVTLSLLDYMEQFDRPYSLSTLTYPTTLGLILQEACTKCGVTLDTTTFPHSDYTVQTKPSEDSITFRDVVGYVATIAGRFAKCTVHGHLELKWFDTTSLDDYYSNLVDGGTFDPWSTGTNYDGGTFNPWTEGDSYDGGSFTETNNVHYIHSLYSQNIALDDVVITGVYINVKDERENATSDIITKHSGTDDYIIEINDNPFITVSTAQDVANWLGTQINGMRFRKLTVTHGSDPSIEAGDVGVVIDRKQNVYPILITRVDFAVDNTQTVVCGAETPSRNNATRYSAQTKSYVEARKLLKQEQSLREQAEENLRQAIANAAGLYLTAETDEQTQKTIYYLHNLPVLSQSAIRIMFSDAGITVTADSGQHWYGLTVNGDMLVNLLSATGISFDWASGGTLTLGGQDNVNGLLRILNASGVEIGKWSKDGISITKGSLQLGKDSSNNPYTSIDDNGRIDTSKLYATYGSLGDMVLTDSSLRYGTPTIPASTTANKVYVGKNGISVDGVNANNYARRVEAKNGEIALYQGSNASCRITAGRRTNNWIETEVYLGNTSGGETQIFSGYHGYHDWYGIETHWYIGNSFIIDFTNPSSVYGFEVRNGTKNRTITTPDYAERSFTCYEMPSPMFGDIGDGVIADDGYCYIQLDPIFSESIMTNNYQVFLQKYGSGECYVSERHPTYFVVCGEPGMEFAWEVKAKQADAGNRRLERYSDRVEINNPIDYGSEAINHIFNIAQEREV